MHTLISILRAAMCHRCWMAMLNVGKRGHCGKCFCCKEAS